MLQIEFGGPDVWPAPVDKKFCVPKQCKSLISYVSVIGVWTVFSSVDMEKSE